MFTLAVDDFLSSSSLKVCILSLVLRPWLLIVLSAELMSTIRRHVRVALSRGSFVLDFHLLRLNSCYANVNFCRIRHRDIVQFRVAVKALFLDAYRLAIYGCRSGSLEPTVGNLSKLFISSGLIAHAIGRW